jgi:hypothetical protein
LREQKLSRRRTTLKKTKLFLTCSLLICFIFLFGCASTGTIQSVGDNAPEKGILSNYNAIKFEVSTSLPDRQDEVKELQQKIIEKAKEKGLESKLSENPNLKVLIKITDVRGVSTAGRILFGGLAGRATVKAQVELIDTVKGKIGELEAEGKSSGGTVFAGTTSQALERLAEQIVDYIAQK